MKNYVKLSAACLAILTGSLIYSCEKDKGSLGSIPKADFDVVQVDANHVVLVNKSSISSIPYWTDVESGSKVTGDSAAFYFGFAGAYDVKLMVAGSGGIDSITKSVTIASNDPNLCSDGTMQNFISGCTEKKWSLLQGAGALGVGPSEGDVSWWGNAADDVTTGRPCTFNDEFTFKLAKSNNFLYDEKGDFYTEDYEGPANWSCADESTLTGDQKAWGTNLTDFSYRIASNAGTHPQLGQLELSGRGAHIALPKVQDGGQYTTGPVSDKLVYNIIDTAHDASGKGILTLSIESPAGTWWRLKLSEQP